MMKTFAFAAALMCVTTVAQAGDHGDHGEYKKKMVDYKFEMMDTNKDAKISADEHEVATKKMFVEADNNGDHLLTREELMQYKKDMPKKWENEKMPKEIVQ